MAHRFFCSMPDAVRVRDPYEEVFLLFTGEGASSSGAEAAEGPWQHNRSVSQTSNTLQVELAFTPVSTPPRTPTMERSLSSSSMMQGPLTSSRPASRPASRAGLRGVAVSNSSGPIESSTTTITDHHSASQPSSPTPSSPKSAGSPLLRPGSKRAAKRSPSSPASPSPLPQQLVIHQSLSTLSQPGQTGSVVWDSSILMAKFLLSIRQLQLSHFMLADKLQGVRNALASMHVADQPRTEQGSEEQAWEQNDQQDQQQDKDERHDPQQEQGEESGEEEEEEDEDEDQDEGWQTRLVFDPRKTSVIELGSGCGLLGMVLVEFCRRLLLTDQSAVLPLLLKNLKKNLDKRYFQDTAPHNNNLTSKRDKTNLASSKQPPTPLCQLQIQELLWGQDLDPDLKRGVGFDFVMATDVIYNEAIIPPLVRTLTDLCRVRERARQQGRTEEQEDGMENEEEAADPGRDSTTGGLGSSFSSASSSLRKLPKTVVLLAQELRTDYVHMSFLEKMKAVPFTIVRIPTSLMDPEFHGGYVIYACWLK